MLVVYIVQFEVCKEQAFKISESFILSLSKDMGARSGL